MRLRDNGITIGDSYTLSVMSEVLDGACLPADRHPFLIKVDSRLRWNDVLAQP